MLIQLLILGIIPFWSWYISLYNRFLESIAANILFKILHLCSRVILIYNFGLLWYKFITSLNSLGNIPFWCLGIGCMWLSFFINIWKTFEENLWLFSSKFSGSITVQVCLFFINKTHFLKISTIYSKGFEFTFTK